MISGARSRLIIILSTFLLIFFTFAYSKLFFKKSNELIYSSNLNKIIASIFFIGFLFFLFNPSFFANNFPLLTFFNQSHEESDFSLRISEALNLSTIPSDITLFGIGLGSISSGKPGEFGILSLWTESGIFFGLPILCIYFFLLFILLKVTLQKFFKRNIIEVAIHFLVFQLLCFGLLFGFTGVFEFSTAILLGSSYPATLRKSNLDTI
jgi:hypothetical protein